jgi:hypothetical protein
MNHNAAMPLAQTPQVGRAWWPLGASWLLMGLELPLIAAVLGRLPDSEVMLAAFGGVVFPLALLIESPIIMMLAASTALATDAPSWRRLNRWMHLLSGGLTVLSLLLAVTPLFDLVVVDLLDVPEAVQAPARLGLLLMLPWTWAIADRRTRQGLLIRYGRKIAVAQGTVIRLLATASGVIALAMAGSTGIVVAAGGLSAGVLAEAVWARWAARSIVRQHVPASTSSDEGQSLRSLCVFYLPLAMTPMLVLLAQPLGTAGMTRMPDPVASMAVWAPLNGLVFLMRSSGMAFNEVVIAHVHEPGWSTALNRFAHRMGLCCTAVLACVGIPAIGWWWFSGIQGLNDDLVLLGTASLWLAAPIPWLTFMQSLYQGRLVAAHRTGAVTVSVTLYLATTIGILAFGVLWGGLPGLPVAVAALTLGNLMQAWWLWRSARRL